MQESLANYEAKIIEITANIAKEKEALIAKRGDAEKKLAEAKAKFDALYGDLPESPAVGNDTTTTELPEIEAPTMFDAPKV